MLEAVVEIDAEVELPKFHARTAEARLLQEPISPDPAGPAYGQRKAALYATCYVDYNKPDTAKAAVGVLAKQGVEAKLVYPECCGMPQFEDGELKEVAARAERIARAFAPYIADGYEGAALPASYALWIKYEGPWLRPDSEPVRKLSRAARDISEYVVGLAKTFGLAPGLQ